MNKLEAISYSPLNIPSLIKEQSWPKETPPFVSVSVLTYNHELFIRNCIDGILMQETTFPVKIVVFEDCSTDRTASIIKEYEKEYPHLFSVFYMAENTFGKKTRQIALKPFKAERAKAKYIAICEGDDYWTDPLKLQKQVDFLEGNEEYVACAHETSVIFENKADQKPYLFSNRKSTDLEIKDFLGHRPFHTASLMFRNWVIKKYGMPNNFTAGDRALYLLLVSVGKVFFSDEVMACYRKNEGGISNWVTAELMAKDLNIVPWIKKINPDFPKNTYLKFIYYTILAYPPILTKKELFKAYFFYCFYSLKENPRSLKRVYIFTRNQLPLFLKKTRHYKSQQYL